MTYLIFIGMYAATIFQIMKYYDRMNEYRA